MRRVIYVAGVNRKHLAEAADSCPYWLVSLCNLPKKGPQAWLEPYLSRFVLWDPGTFSPEGRTYPQYREWLERHARPHHKYLSYDEVGGDPELNVAYLRDMRRRGFKPWPVYHPGMPKEILTAPECAVGSLVRQKPSERGRYLDDLLFGPDAPTGNVHLLGMGQKGIFRRYRATSGDSTTWTRPWAWNQLRSRADWMKEYGEQEIPLRVSAIQARLAL